MYFGLIQNIRIYNHNYMQIITNTHTHTEQAKRLLRRSCDQRAEGFRFLPITQRTSSLFHEPVTKMTGHCRSLPNGARGLLRPLWVSSIYCCFFFTFSTSDNGGNCSNAECGWHPEKSAFFWKRGRAGLSGWHEGNIQPCNILRNILSH